MRFFLVNTNALYYISLQLLILLTGSFNFQVAAQDAANSDVVVLSQSFEVNFAPEEAYFLIESETVNKKLRALLIPPFSKDEQDRKQDRWWMGAALKIPKENTPFDYSILLKGKADEVLVLSGFSAGVADDYLNAMPKLLKEVENKKAVLKSWEVQVQAQADNLRRLRADAEVVANVGRIIELLEEIEATKYEIENLDKDIAVLQESFKQVKNQTSPKNFTRRELELTKQISELAQVVKSAESGESGRTVSTQSELQRKLALVESTRFDNEEQLRAELAKFQGTQPVKPKGGQSNDYWESE